MTVASIRRLESSTLDTNTSNTTFYHGLSFTPFLASKRRLATRHPSCYRPLASLGRWATGYRLLDWIIGALEHWVIDSTTGSSGSHLSISSCKRPCLLSACRPSVCLSSHLYSCETLPDRSPTSLDQPLSFALFRCLCPQSHLPTQIPLRLMLPAPDRLRLALDLLPCSSPEDHCRRPKQPPP